MTSRVDWPLLASWTGCLIFIASFWYATIRIAEWAAS